MGGGNLAHKNKKGFTLLEVLAVIVVLAVIAVITVPIVTGVMSDAKKNSFKTSMTNLVKAANNYYADNQLSMDSVITFCFGLTGSNCTSEKLKFSGKQPEKGKLVINPDGEISLLDMSNGTYYANYDSSIDDDIVITEDNQILNRDELTQAIKDLQKKLEEAEKKISTKASQSDLDKTNTQLNTTTTIANTANSTANSLNTNMLNKTYPVGSIYISYSSTNPKSLFGGTWVAFGTGRTLVGIDTSNANFNSLGKTGGSSSQSIKLTTANLPGHTHSIPALSGSTNTTGNHTHSLATYNGARDFVISNNLGSGISGIPSGSGAWGSYGNAHWFSLSYYAIASGNHSHTVTTNASTTGSTGSATAFSVNTQNPYITVYMWRRTA